MSPIMSAGGPRQYAVFISYRHADNVEMGRKWANWLHEALESYEVPPDLVGKTSLRGDKVPASLYPVFRDEEELPADADLSTNIRRALENSGLLVVLCSPRAVLSRFVADEIRHFKELGKSDRILALMIDGEPNASDDPAKVAVFGAGAECFPEPLRFGVAGEGDATNIDWTARTEPIAADVRPGGHCVQGWTTAAAYREQLVKEGGLTARQIVGAVNDYNERLELAKLKIIAGALGLPLGDLTQRNKAFQLAKAKQRAKVLRRWMAVVGACAIAAIGSAWLAVAAKREVEEKNAINLKNLHEASMADYAAALQRMEKDGQWKEGVVYLTRSLKWWPENPLAAARLYSTLAFHAAEKQSWPRSIMSRRYPEREGEFSPDGTRLVTTSQDFTVRLWDVASGNLVGDPIRHTGIVYQTQFSVDGTRLVTASQDKTVRVFDAATGKPVGEPLLHDDIVTKAEFSPDGARIVTISGVVDPIHIRVWDASSGRQLGKLIHYKFGDLSAEFSPDGTRIMTIGKDYSKGRNIAQIWDSMTGDAVGEPLHPEADVTIARFNPDGTRVVTAARDNTARVWDATSGKPIGEPLLHEYEVHDAKFSPDGRLIVSACLNKGRLWDAESGKPVGEPLYHENQVDGVRFSPDSTRIATFDRDGNAQVWDAASGKPIGGPLSREASVKSLQFSPDGIRLLTSSGYRNTQVWDAASGRQLGEAMPHKDNIISTRFSPDGRYIHTVTIENTAQVWDAPSGRPLGEPLRHEISVEAAQFSPDGKQILTVSWGNNAQLWDAATSKLSALTLLTAGARVTSTLFGPKGTRIATISNDEGARVLDVASGAPVGEPLSHSEDVRTPLEMVKGALASVLGEPQSRTNFLINAQFSPDGMRIVTAGDDGTARVWDVASGKLVGEPLRHEGPVRGAQFSPDGTRIVTMSDDQTARVWQVASGKPVGEELSHEGPVSGARFSPDGTRIVTVSGKIAQVWDAESGNPQGGPMSHWGDVASAQFSPDSKRIVTVSYTSVRVWDAESGKPLGEPMKHELEVHNAQFSLDGRRIVTASEDKTARVWDAATGKPFGESLRHEEKVNSAEFSADGTRIVTASDDATARLWEVSHALQPPVPVPAWMLGCAKAIAGLEFDENGQMQSIAAEQRYAALIKPPQDDDAWSSLARWLARPAKERTLTPESKFTCRQIAERERDSGFQKGIESALRYDATVPLAHVLLAKFESNPQRADFLRGYGLELLPPDEVSLWARAATSLVEQKDFKRGLQTADKTLALAPKSIPALRARAQALEALKREQEALTAYHALLVAGGAEVYDFTNPAYLAAKLGNKTEADFFLDAGRSRMAGSERFARMEGWTHIVLGKKQEAFAAFHRAELLVESGKKPDTDLLIGLAISLWLTGQPDEAVAAWQKLVEADFKWRSPETVSRLNWPKTETEPMEAVRAETLKRHPELNEN